MRIILFLTMEFQGKSEERSEYLAYLPQISSENAIISVPACSDLYLSKSIKFGTRTLIAADHPPLLGLVKIPTVCLIHLQSEKPRKYFFCASDFIQ